MNQRAEAIREKALKYERAAEVATDPTACSDYLNLARQLRAKAEVVEALEQAANLRRGVWFTL
jgi:hypothetical protein